MGLIPPLNRPTPGDTLYIMPPGKSFLPQPQIWPPCRPRKNQPGPRKYFTPGGVNPNKRLTCLFYLKPGNHQKPPKFNPFKFRVLERAHGVSHPCVTRIKPPNCPKRGTQNVGKSKKWVKNGVKTPSFKRPGGKHFGPWCKWVLSCWFWPKVKLVVVVG